MEYDTKVKRAVSICKEINLMVNWVISEAFDLPCILIRLSGKIKKFDFHPGNLSMAVYTYEKPPKKVSGFVGHPVTQAINV